MKTIRIIILGFIFCALCQMAFNWFADKTDINIQENTSQTHSQLQSSSIIIKAV